MGKTKLGWGARVERTGGRNAWSLGLFVARFDREVYLLLNLLMWSIAVGRMEKEQENEDI